MDFEKTFPLRFLVNLGRRQDRRIEAEDELEKHGITFERFSAVDAKWLRHPDRGENPGWYACALTQRLVVREAMRRDAEAVLILEDDIVLDPLFLQKIETLELPDDWGAFYFGCQHCNEPEVVSPHLVKVAWALDFHAFAIRKPYYKAFLEAISPSLKCGAETYSAPDLKFARYQVNKVPCYASYPNLIWQRAVLSDNTQSEKSNYSVFGRQNWGQHAIRGLNSQAMGFQRWEEVDRSQSDEGGHLVKDGKVAFLFLTRADSKHSNIWNEYFAGHESDISLYTHAKYSDSIEEKWMSDSLIDDYVKTKWGDISLVDATLSLLKNALEDKSNQTFILLSESCVPIKPFSHLKRSRKISSQNWLQLTHAEKIPNDNWRLRRLAEAEHRFDINWWFHSQWFMLNREAVEALLERDMTQFFHNVHAIDESYIATVLDARGYPVEDNFFQQDVTYTKWTDGDAHPHSFENVTSEFALELAQSPHFFARKFSDKSNIGDYRLHLD